MSDVALHRTKEELEDGMAHVRDSPADDGTVELIVRRPGVDERELLEVGQLNPQEGLAGDTWNQRGSRKSADGGPHPGMQITLMNARVAELVAGSPQRWALAGDQLYVDLNLSTANLPAGTQLSVGEAMLEITEHPHTGCAKFAQRFGREALRFVNSKENKGLNLRGVNTRVVQGGTVRTGDRIIKRSL